MDVNQLWARNDPRKVVNFWFWSGSRCKYKISFSHSLTLRDGHFMWCIVTHQGAPLQWFGRYGILYNVCSLTTVRQWSGLSGVCAHWVLLFCLRLLVVNHLFTVRSSSTRHRLTTFQRACSTRRKSSAVPRKRPFHRRASSAAVPFCRTKNIARAGLRRFPRTTCSFASQSVTALTKSSRSSASR